MYNLLLCNIISLPILRIPSLVYRIPCIVITTIICHYIRGIIFRFIIFLNLGLLSIPSRGIGLLYRI